MELPPPRVLTVRVTAAAASTAWVQASRASASWRGVGASPAVTVPPDVIHPFVEKRARSAERRLSTSQLHLGRSTFRHRFSVKRGWFRLGELSHRVECSAGDTEANAGELVSEQPEWRHLGERLRSVVRGIEQREDPLGRHGVVNCA